MARTNQTVKPTTKTADVVPLYPTGTPTGSTGSTGSTGGGKGGGGGGGKGKSKGHPQDPGPDEEHEGKGKHKDKAHKAEPEPEPTLSPIGYALGGLVVGWVGGSFLGFSPALSAGAGGVIGYLYGSSGGVK